MRVGRSRVASELATDPAPVARRRLPHPIRPSASLCYERAVAKGKRFKLKGSDIRALVPGLGGCIASDKITVHGQRVAYMVRGEPAAPEDSGWVFTAGTESQAYMDDPANFEVYDVNTIANYDRDIIPFLRAPAGSSFERPGNEDDLEPCEGTDWTPGTADEQAAGEQAARRGGKWPPPGFPIVEGEHALTSSWSLTLPSPFARRIEDDSLVLWRPGLTLCIAAFNNDHREPQAARLAAMKDTMSPDATSVREDTAGGVTRLTYRLVEDGQKSVSAIVIGATGHLHASIYFDDEADAATALRIAASIAARTP